MFEREFDLNIYDEQELDVNSFEIPEYIKRTLDKEQKELANSKTISKRYAALDKLKKVAEENIPKIIEDIEIADELRRGNEGGEKERYQRLVYEQSLESLKHWQILDVIDGAQLEGNEREKHQEYISMFPETLQTAFDLYLNSALLSDIVPNARNLGSIDILNKVILDKNSLFYSSITPEFNKRVINEAYWQVLSDVTNFEYSQDILENILSQQEDKLDESLANDRINILNFYGKSPHHYMQSPDLIKYNWHEEFEAGLSLRAIKAQGRFLDKVVREIKSKPSLSQDKIDPFIQQYIDTINFKNSKYTLKESQREELSSYNWVESFLEKEKKVSAV